MAANLSKQQTFKSQVGIKFQLYNSLFTSLPFHRIESTGILLSMLQLSCEEGFKKKKSPVEIVDDFFSAQTSVKSDEKKLDMLFRFVQYIERQVVLFDALEDAAFKNINELGGQGTLTHLALEIEEKHLEQHLKNKLSDFNVHLVLTAHPTQFYRGAVLGIIHDLANAIAGNNENKIYSYLQQLGRTPFLQHQKPTPYDEAVSLFWYLENIFYPASGKIISFIKNRFPNCVNIGHPLIRMGFWPGGDRDGNPFVTTETTLQVANSLRGNIVKCYYLDIRKLKRRLTFKGVDTIVQKLENRLYENLFIPETKFNLNVDEFLNELNTIRELLVNEHNSLFIEQVNSLMNKVELFGFYFATLDIRQESAVHEKMLNNIAQNSHVLPANYSSLSDEEKINLLVNIHSTISPNILSNAVYKDTLQVMGAVKTIQQTNGEMGCNRYIISQCNSVLNVFEVFGLFLLSGWNREELTIDIVPLFETIDDLTHAQNIMQQLYENEFYREHLARRNNKQTIMLGFSDGTKDGGYMMANWSIYKAKEALTAISKKYDIDVLFFDGRGGPPARGGGKTHQFYASLGKNISNKEIQITIQGQTVSANFGTVDSAQFNMEQLIHAGIANDILNEKTDTLKSGEEKLLQTLSEESYKAYIDLKDNPDFIEYLLHVSPLKFYSDTNIGSRPAKRGGSSKITLKELRAIPFVASWSQLKQGITGYYGVGAAMKKMEEEGKFEALQKLYKESLFFKTLMDNCEMAMQKCFFPLTEYLSTHQVYGEIWNKIYDEFELTKKYILKLSGNSELMENYPVDYLSIQMRERIVLPLLTIQQYTITKARELDEQLTDSPLKATYEKLAMRCSFGIINASRNSA
jgi:phosphoenolpyruvate carboxylase